MNRSFPRLKKYFYSLSVQVKVIFWRVKYLAVAHSQSLSLSSPPSNCALLTSLLSPPPELRAALQPPCLPEADAPSSAAHQNNGRRRGELGEASTKLSHEMQQGQSKTRHEPPPAPGHFLLPMVSRTISANTTAIGASPSPSPKNLSKTQRENWRTKRLWPSLVGKAQKQKYVIYCK